MTDRERMEFASKVDYYTKYPLSFLEEILGVKLTKWQKFIVNNTDKIKFGWRSNEKKYNFYVRLCLTYMNMKDDEHIVIASPDKIERLSRDELFNLIIDYWK